MKKRFTSAVCCVLALCAMLTSCSNKDNGLFTVSVGGNAYDVMVVGDPDVWKSEAGRTLFDVLDEDMPGLPQLEPMFNIIFLKTQDFTDIVRPMRSIIFFDVDDSHYTQGKVSFSRDKWANTQSIVKITAPNQEEMIRVVKEKKQKIVDFLVEGECERCILYFDRYANSDGKKMLRDKLGVRVSLPNYINKSKVGDNFIWMSNGSLDARLDILAYRTPYGGEKDMTLERILDKRDSLTKIYVPGPSEGSYMCVERDEIPPVDRKIIYKGRKCTEVRGLWRTENEFMGGPFVSRTFVDTVRQETVTLEAFVYAPQHKKRNKIRLVEAVLHSLEFE